MVARLRAALRPPGVLLAKSVAAWRAVCLQAAGLSTEAVVEAEAEAGIVKAWKSSDQLS